MHIKNAMQTNGQQKLPKSPLVCELSDLSVKPVTGCLYTRAVIHCSLCPQPTTPNGISVASAILPECMTDWRTLDMELHVYWQPLLLCSCNVANNINWNWQLKYWNWSNINQHFQYHWHADMLSSLLVTEIWVIKREKRSSEYLCKTHWEKYCSQSSRGMYYSDGCCCVVCMLALSLWNSDRHSKNSWIFGKQLIVLNDRFFTVYLETQNKTLARL